MSLGEGEGVLQISLGSYIICLCVNRMADYSGGPDLGSHALSEGVQRSENPSPAVLGEASRHELHHCKDINFSNNDMSLEVDLEPQMSLNSSLSSLSTLSLLQSQNSEQRASLPSAHIPDP